MRHKFDNEAFYFYVKHIQNISIVFFMYDIKLRICNLILIEKKIQLENICSNKIKLEFIF